MPDFFQGVNYEGKIENFYQKLVKLVKIFKFCSQLEVCFYLFGKFRRN